MELYLYALNCAIWHQYAKQNVLKLIVVHLVKLKAILGFQKRSLSLWYIISTSSYRKLGTHNNFK